MRASPPSAVWKLQASPGYQMRTTKCVSYVRSKRVIAAVGGFALLGPEAHVVAFLLAHKGLPFCDACLAFPNEISLEDAQRVAAYLHPLPEFERRAAGECSVCTRTRKPVISARASAGDEHAPDRDPDGLASVGSSTVHYRGWRIDVLSYRVAAGWRPFIVITARREPSCPMPPPCGTRCRRRRRLTTTRSPEPRSGSTSASEAGVS